MRERSYQDVVVVGVSLGGLVFVHFMLFALAVSLSPEESVTKRRDWAVDRQS